jgi:hypothetical protein
MSRKRQSAVRPYKAFDAGNGDLIRLVNKTKLKEIVGNAREQGINPWVALAEHANISREFVLKAITMTEEEVQSLPTVLQLDAQALRDLIIEQLGMGSRNDVQDPQLFDRYQHYLSAVETDKTRISLHPSSSDKGYDKDKHQYDGGDVYDVVEPFDPELLGRIWAMPSAIVAWPSKRLMFMLRGLWDLHRTGHLCNPKALYSDVRWHLRRQAEILGREIKFREAEPWRSTTMNMANQLSVGEKAKPGTFAKKRWDRFCQRWLGIGSMLAEAGGRTKLQRIMLAIHRRSRIRERVPIGIAYIPEWATDTGLREEISKLCSRRYTSVWAIQAYYDPESTNHVYIDHEGQYVERL